jgi:hypothetical protein
MLGPHFIILTDYDSNHALYQQLNWQHNQITQSYDCYFNSNNWISSDSNANFQIHKQNGSFLFRSACNMSPGQILDSNFRTALAINSNSFLTIGDSNPLNRITIRAEDQSMLGPHFIILTDYDSNHALYQQLNWKHDQITQSYDCYFDSNNWISSHSNANFQIQKQDGSFLFRSACNTLPGQILDSNWRTALAINSNSFLTIGDSNPLNRITVRAEDQSMLGPHMIFLTNTDSNHALFQQLNWQHNQITQSYDCYFNSNNWISSDSNANFQIQKQDGKFLFKSSCNNTPGQIVNFRTALAINSNSFIGIGTSNPTHRVTLIGASNNTLGPHTAYSLEDDTSNLLLQNLNWQHDSIHMAFDSYYDGSNWISSSSTTNFKISKSNSHFTISSKCNIDPTSNIIWSDAFSITSNNFVGINLLNPTHRLTIIGENNDYKGPHVAYYLSTDSNKPVYQQLNLTNNYIAQSYDCYYDSNILISSDSNANFQIHKEDGKLLFKSSCNNTPGDIINSNLRVALAINSNSFIGIGTSNPNHRLTHVALSNNMLGPHVAYCMEDDINNPVLQNLNWQHDSIHMAFDSYFDGINWISSSSTTNFKISKSNSHFTISSKCNVLPNQTITWSEAFSITSNNLVGINTLDPTHRLTILGENASKIGPHMVYYLMTDTSNPVYQHLNWQKDDISQSYNSYFDGTNWISSSNNANFRIHYDGYRLNFKSASNVPTTSNIDWYDALTVNSNSFIGIGLSNPTHRVTIAGPSNSQAGPNQAFYFLEDPINPVFQIYNSNNDNISLNFDSYWDGQDFISSTTGANFQIKKAESKLLFQTTSYADKSSNINAAWRVGVAINSNSFVGIATSNPVLPLDVNGQSIFRSNINITGHILPNSNMTMDLGSSNNRFRDIYLSGTSVDMEGLKLQKDFYTGGLLVYDSITSQPTRTWVKELMIGNPIDALNSNVFLLTASGKGIQLQNVTPNLPPQKFSQLNNMYITPMTVGIGNSNAEKSLQVNGDVEINPNENLSIFWSGIQIQLNSYDLNNINNSSITSWGSFNAQNSPTYFKSGGYNDSAYIQCLQNNSYFISPSNWEFYNDYYGGFTLLLLARFTRDPQSNEKLVSFSNNNYLFELSRHELSKELTFSTNEITLTCSNFIMQNQWSLITVKMDYGSSELNIYKNGSNIAQTTITSIADMSFLPGIQIGNANVDISSLYFFQRPLDSDEIGILTKKLIYPSHKSLEIKTDSKSYPPPEFNNDTFGWLLKGMSDNNQIYAKTLENVYYGNGEYKMWANTSSNQSIQYAFSSNLDLSWTTQSALYNDTIDFTPAPTIYIELSKPIRLQYYDIMSEYLDTSRSPSKWTLYGSQDKNIWVTLDQQVNQTLWTENETRRFNLINAMSFKIYKLEINRNNSGVLNYTSVANLTLYGDEHSFSIDGTGVGINTPYPKKDLSVHGNAEVTNTMTIGKYEDILRQSLYEYPPYPMTSDADSYNSKLIIITQSSYYNNDINYKGYRAFTKSISDEWVADISKYTNTFYTGSITTLVDTTTISGEWIQIQLVDSINLVSYKLTPKSDYITSGPKTFYIAGSQTGTTWTQLNKQTDFIWQNNQSHVFTINNTVLAYKYYRLIINKIQGTGTDTVAISDLTLYGSIYEHSDNNIGQLTVKGNTHITNRLSIGVDYKETLYEADARDLLNLDESAITQWGDFNITNTCTYIKKISDDPYVYFPNSTYLDAGQIILNLTQGFTAVFLARFHANTTQTTLLCSCDDNTTDNQLFFGKLDNNQTLYFIVNNISIQCFNLSTLIEEDKWHVYSIRYDPITYKASLYIDNECKLITSATTALIDRTTQHLFIGRNALDSAQNSTLALKNFKIWNTYISDDEFYQYIANVYSLTTMFVKGTIKITDGFVGDLDFKSTHKYTTANYQFPPIAMYDNTSLLNNNYYGNGTYKTTASTNASQTYYLFDYNATTSYLSSAQYSTNSYLGTEVTSLADNTFIKGSWIGFEVPFNIIMTYYIFTPRSTDYATTAPTSWYLIGSEDNYKWRIIGASPQVNSVWTSSSLTVNLNHDKSYRYYRWIFTGSSGTAIGLQSISTYGQITNVMSIKDTNVIIMDKLGINISEPAASLHVAGFSVLSGLKIIPGNASNIIVPTNPGGISDANISSSGGSSSNASINGINSDPTGLSFNISGNNSSYAFRYLTGPTSNEILRINGLGNVGIGLTSPGEKLHVFGNAKITSNAYILNSVSIGKSNPTVALDVIGSAKISSNITFMGQLIGTKSVLDWTSWSTQLTNNSVSVYLAKADGRGLIINTGSQSAITQAPYTADFYNTAALECINGDLGSLLYVRNDGKIGIGSSNISETLSIVGNLSLSNLGKVIFYTSNNNLGINTNTPSKALDVVGDINVSGSFYQNGAPLGLNSWTTTQTNIYVMSNIGIGTSNNLERLAVGGDMSLNNYGKIIFTTSNNNLGINSPSPTESLSISGNTLSLSNYGKVILYSSNSYLGVGVSNPRFPLDVLGDLNISGMLYQGNQPYISSQWLTNSSNVYFSSGYVGIGTNTPASKLHVSGDITTQVLLPEDVNSVIGLQTQQFKTTYTSNIYINSIQSSNSIIQVAVSMQMSNLYLQNNSNVITLQVQSNNLVFYSSNEQKIVTGIKNVYITDSNIGIGTSITPEVLTVAGNVQIGVVKLMNPDINTFAISNIKDIYAYVNSLTFSNSGSNTLYSSNSYLGLNNTNPQFTLDINGDINFTNRILQNGTEYTQTRWSCNVTGIYEMSNVGIKQLPTSTEALAVLGDVSISNIESLVTLVSSNNNLNITTQSIGLSNYGIVSLYSSNNYLGINNSNPAFALDVNGSINLNGGQYMKDGQILISSRWSCNVTGIYENSNIGVKQLPTSTEALAILGDISVSNTNSIIKLSGCNNALKITTQSIDINNYGNVSLYSSNNYLGINNSNPAFALDVTGSINLNGGQYMKDGQILTSSRWSCNATGIYVMSNMSIQTNSNDTYALNINGDLNFTGSINNNGVPYIPSLPGLTAVNSNAYFTNGLYMKGLRISAGLPDFANIINTASNMMLYIPGSTSNESFKFMTGPTSNEIVTITANGKVGINTTNPLQGLHVNANALISGQSITISNSSAPYMLIQANGRGTALMGVATTASIFSTSADTGDYVIKTFTGGKVILQSSNAGAALCINTNNNVGIKNSAAVYELDVTGDINFTGNLRKGGALYVGSQWSNVGSNVYLLNSNVGIGKSNPTYPLDVTGDLNFTGNLYKNGALYVGSQWSNVGSNVFLLNSNVGIGKSNPTYPLDVTGDLNFTGNLYKNGALYVGSQWSNVGSNVFILNSNVGIGTSNPSYNLEVAGTIYASGDITVFSDSRYKTNVICISDALNKIDKITGYTFNSLIQTGDTRKICEKYAGVLAQEVEKILPEVVYEDKNGCKSIAYGNLTALIIQAVKELKNQVIGTDKSESNQYTYPSGDYTFEPGQIVGFSSPNKLTDKFSESKFFGISAGNNKIYTSGKVQFSYVPNVEVGHYIIPCKGLNDNIEYYTISDSKITFEEYRQTIGRIISIDDDGILNVVIKSI